MKRGTIIEAFKLINGIKMNVVSDKATRSAVISNHLMMYKIAQENDEEVKKIYDDCYKDEYFVRVLDKNVCPETRWVEGSNFVDVNFRIDERTGRVIMMGAMDNLVKGAAGQAIQNMNLMFGLPETMGLELVPMFP